MERSPYWYVTSINILNNNCKTAFATKNVVRKVLFPLCLIKHIPLSSIKMTQSKKRIKQVLEKNGYQGSIISKNLRELAYTACLSRNNKRKPQTSKRMRSE